MTKELTMAEDEDTPQNGSVAIVFQLKSVDTGIRGLIHNDELVEMASAMMYFDYDCSEYTDEELAEAYDELSMI